MINLIDFEAPIPDFKDIYNESESLDNYLYEEICHKSHLEFNILSRKEVFSHINHEIQKYSNLLQISFIETRGILIKNAWKIEEIFDL